MRIITPAKWLKFHHLYSYVAGSNEAVKRPKSTICRQLKESVVPQSYKDRFAKGVRNLLMNCADCRPGQSVLIVCETDTVGYYDPMMGYAIQTVGEQLDLKTKIVGVPWNRDVCDPSKALTQKMIEADCTLFLARLGDQIRFRPRNSATTQVISYALDCEMLASPFGTIDYRAFEVLRDLINTAVLMASDIHVTCPAGTDFRGSPSVFTTAGSDITRKRFPISVHAPITAGGFRGCIAQNGFLTGTGSQYYTPWSCRLDDTLFVNFEDNHITGFDGLPNDVAAAKAHYEFVGEKYGLDTYYVHSWHGGIHPACAFFEPAGVHFERWSGSAFGNPRLMHFHTCGAYPPGEISLNILDPTIRIDGIAVWEGGVLHPERMTGGAALLDAYPDMQLAFKTPETQVGQAACGCLSYA
jgi:hypothetical protein